jgi:adenylate cyclase
LYAVGLADYRARRFAEAAQAFAGAVGADAGDGAARLMRDRCRQYQASPPPPGEHVLTDK